MLSAKPSSGGTQNVSIFHQVHSFVFFHYDTLLKECDTKWGNILGSTNRPSAARDLLPPVKKCLPNNLLVSLGEATFSTLSPLPMLSLPPQPVTSTVDACEAAISVNELGNIQDAIKPITELFTSTHEDSVRLFCTVPTWSPSSDICIDLHDLNTLRSRSLHFIHDLVNSLRESGVRASYKLMPSNSPLCLICACHSRLDTNAIQVSAQDAYTKMKMGVRERVLLVELVDGRALVVT